MNLLGLIVDTTRIWIKSKTILNNQVTNFWVKLLDNTLIAFMLLKKLYCTYITHLEHVMAAFCINMWTLAREQRFLTHRLCSRIKYDQPQGYAVFDWESILHGNPHVLVDYKELVALPNKIALCLYEFHSAS
jgi:hypothetical protein